MNILLAEFSNTQTCVSGVLWIVNVFLFLVTIAWQLWHGIKYERILLTQYPEKAAEYSIVVMFGSAPNGFAAGYNLFLGKNLGDALLTRLRRRVRLGFFGMLLLIPWAAMSQVALRFIFEGFGN